MAVQELRKFKFFDLNLDVDKGSLAATLKDTVLVVATSGNNNFFFGDGEGNVVFFNKTFEPSIFKAFNISICFAEFIKHSPYLVTVGEDEAGINPLLKVWNVDVVDKGRSPRCVRVTRLIPNNKAVAVTAIGVHENANFLAVGFKNGSILLFRGDVSRDKSSKSKLLKDSGSSAITGLAFRTSATSSYLFVTSENAVVSYDITTKDKEIKWQLHNVGCPGGCSVMAELPHEAHFVVARDSAIYCYTADGKGPCYAIGGVKKLIQWSKSFVIVISQAEKELNQIGMTMNVNRDSVDETDNITVLDFHNNLSVFSSTLPEVKAVLVECGTFYIITRDNRVHQLVEKDVQSKLSLLFKKNLYDIAIRLAKSQQYDEDGLAEIFRQYGDHLNSKGDRTGAIEQYIKTIGKLEPSYIIRKFMDSAHMEQLKVYLEALHRKGVATADHTTLLLNCYIKLGRATELKDFIMTKGRTLDFDIEIALKVVRRVNAEDALSLAKAHGRHMWVLKILIQDLNKYQEAISYLSRLEFSQAEKGILTFGGTLMEHCPEKMVNYLKAVWTEEADRSQTGAEEHCSGGGGSVPTGLEVHEMTDCGPRPHQLLHLFLLKSEYLVEFVEHLVNIKTGWDPQIYNALIEHYLVLWKQSKEGLRSNIEVKLMKHLENPDVRYDREHALLLCQMYQFNPGRIFLFEENKMYYQVVEAHMEAKNYKSVLAACRRFGQLDPSIWIQTLWSATKHSDVPSHVLSEILSTIDKEKLEPALMTLDALEGATLGQARRYLAQVLKAEEDALRLESAIIEKYGQDTARVRARLADLHGGTVIFQGSRCSVCNRQLELPSVHFLCQHSFHQHCLQGYAENENECIVCLKNNKALTDMIKCQEKNGELNDQFQQELQTAADGFKVVSDYFGRGVFNQVNVAQPPPSAAIAKSVDFNAMKREVAAVHMPRTVDESKPYIPVPARILPDEKPIALSLTSASIRRSPSPAALAAPYVNPFDQDEDDYDSSLNPFEDDGPVDEAVEVNPFAREADDRNSFAKEGNIGNPFEGDDNYDNDLNPFE